MESMFSLATKATKPLELPFNGRGYQGMGEVNRMRSDDSSHPYLVSVSVDIRHTLQTLIQEDFL